MPDPAANTLQATPWVSQAVWHVRLLGAVHAHSALRSLRHLPSRATGLLLARLALEPERYHPREELVELLWPGVDLAVGRNRLRQTLSTLKLLLQPHGEGAGSGAADTGSAVLVADRLSISAAPGALSCDALALERALHQGRWADAQALLGTSRSPDFMPGFYEDWVQDYRQRLAALVDRMPTHDAQAVPAGRAVTPATVSSFVALGLPEPGTSLEAVSSGAPQVRLPLYLSTLFGVGPALQQVQQRVQLHRLVTLLGPGGAGKTRLAVEVARRSAAPESALGFDRVQFVSLVSGLTGAHVLEALATALQLPAPLAASAERMAQALGSTRCLLVLDNCEQLAADAVAPVAVLLGACPGLHVLATSRRPLALEGENEFEVLPLQLPLQSPLQLPLHLVSDPSTASTAPHTQTHTHTPVDSSPAVALFIERARAVRADFRPSQPQALAALVHALHGLPLAIELAASRVRTFTPQAMLNLLTQGQAGQRLDLLQRHSQKNSQKNSPYGEHPSGPDHRHASMRRVVQWGWQLLEPEQQHTLVLLSVFVAPFSMHAATALAGASASLALDHLVAHSMVTRVPTSTVGDADTAPRFALLGPVLDFLREQQASPNWPSAQPAPAALRNQLRAALLQWAQSLHPSTPLASMQHELTELRALLQTAVADQACVQTLKIALALRPWWDGDGLAEADLAAVEAVLQQWPAERAALQGPVAVDPSQGDRADVHELLAYLQFGAGHVEQARQHAHAALQWAGKQPGPRARALLRQVWVELASYQLQPTHLGTLQEALVLSETSADRATQARVLHQMAIIELQTGDNWAVADRLLERSQQLWLALGDRTKASARQRSRAELLHRQCRWAQALLVYDETEAQALLDGDWVGMMDSALLRGLALAGQHNWAAAAQALARCTAVASQRHHVHGLAYALWHQSRVLARLRRPEAAARLMGFAGPFWQMHVGPLTAQALALQRRVQRLVAAQAGSAHAQAWLAAGRLMTLQAAQTLATNIDS